MSDLVKKSNESGKQIIVNEITGDEVMVISQPTKITGHVSNNHQTIIVKDTEVEFDHGEISGGFLSEGELLFLNTDFTGKGANQTTPIIDIFMNKTRINNCTFRNIDTPIIQSILLGMYKPEKSQTSPKFYFSASEAIIAGDEPKDNIQLIIENCIFENCSMSEKESEMAIITLHTAPGDDTHKAFVLIKNCTFRNCLSTRGVIRLEDTWGNGSPVRIVMQDCTFDNCKKLDNDLVIGESSTNTEKITLHNCTFTNCDESDAIYYGGEFGMDPDDIGLQVIDTIHEGGERMIDAVFAPLGQIEDAITDMFK